MTMSVVILSLLGLVITARPVGPPGTSSQEALRRYLADQAGFSAEDWRDVLAGRAVAKNLDTPEAVDVSILGVVRIRGRAVQLVEEIRAIDTFEQKLNVEAVGRFADPPRLSDLEGLRLSGQDFRDLRRCRYGNCELQLSARAMDRFHTIVDWDDGYAEAQANRVYREMFFDVLRAYRIGGVAALGAYVDREPPTSIPAEVQGLANPADSPVPIDDLLRYLREYPWTTLPGAETFFYWNTGNFGMKSTTRLNQVVIHPVQEPTDVMPGARYVIATRQIYANHYFSATLELRTLIDDTSTGEEAFFLVYATRSRVTGLSGFFKALIRGTVKRRARSGMERYLSTTQAVLEAR